MGDALAESKKIGSGGAFFVSVLLHLWSEFCRIIINKSLFSEMYGQAGNLNLH